MTQNYALMQHFVLVAQGMRPPVGEVYAPNPLPPIENKQEKQEKKILIIGSGPNRIYALMQHFVLVAQGMRPPVGEVYAPVRGDPIENKQEKQEKKILIIGS
ncbi:hypothetical protein DD742_08210, partial [Helicobacter pylori]